MILCLLDSGAGLDSHQLRTQVLLETCAHSGDHQLCHLLMAVTSDVSMPFCFATCKQFLLFRKSKSGLLEPVGQVESVSVAVLEEGFQSRPLRRASASPVRWESDHTPGSLCPLDEVIRRPVLGVGWLLGTVFMFPLETLRPCCPRAEAGVDSGGLGTWGGV